VQRAARNISNFEAYAIDYMPGDQMDSFLSSFSASKGGKAWKASESADLAPIFEKVSSKLIHRYILAYKFYYPPVGSAYLSPDTVNVEEITTIDSSPMLNHIYFTQGESIIDDRYQQFTTLDQTRNFSETSLSGGLEKYHNVLNIIGSRLRENETAEILLVGCNSNHGEEKGRTDLSRARAESVKAYLRYVWGINQERIAVEARNLPRIPSTSRVEEGRAENRRVEIHCDQLDILAPVQSTYLRIKSDAESLQILADISSEHGLDSWKATVLSDEGIVWTQQGQDNFTGNIILPSKVFTPEKLSGFKQLKATIEITDIEGQTLKITTEPTQINFIQKKQRLARNLGYMVEEKYALILFDFDSAEIKDRNAAIVEQIIERIISRPDAAVNIVGHTDSIGKERYNLKLSERRAKAVYDKITEDISPDGSRAIQYSGIGPFEPIYPNDSPENRALNRTVIVTLVYENVD
jgi:outer membrane protein OmpA-like peptidoglycan-associated protein